MGYLLDRAYHNASEYGRCVSNEEYYELMNCAQYRTADSQKAWNAFANAKYLKENKMWDPFQHIRNRDHNREGSYASLGSITIISGGCFITSACIAHMNEVFDDNCHELKVLRNYRDSYLRQHHPDEIDIYYRIAPKLVERIDSLPECKSIYSGLYDDMVLPSVRAIEEGEYEKAYEIYSRGCYRLIERFSDE